MGTATHFMLWRHLRGVASTGSLYIFSPCDATGCAWYWIGRQKQAAHGTVPEMSGWAQSGGDGRWSTNSSMYTFYLLAFHSVNPKLANLGDGVQTAQTDLELLFSIIAELVAMIVFGACCNMPFSCSEPT